MSSAKKIFFIFFFFIANCHLALARSSWVFWWAVWADELRKWDIHVDDIPWMIRWVINFLLWIAWTVAIIFIIFWAYKILFSWWSWWKSEWKNVIIMALTGFAIASLAWFIIRFVIDNLQW